MYLRRTVIFLLLFILAGCSSQFYSKGEPLERGKGALFLNIVYHNDFHNKESKNKAAAFVLFKINKGEAEKSSRVTMFSDQVKVLILEPGKYFIGRGMYNNGRWTENYDSRLFQFEIKEGQALYPGTLFINNSIKNVETKYHVNEKQDTYYFRYGQFVEVREKIKQQVITDFPTLKDSFVTRKVKLSFLNEKVEF